MDAANAAIDAEVRVDMEHGFLDARDGFGRALHFAEGAPDAVLEDRVGHGNSFYIPDESVG
jgi:hypothetical protein